MLPVVNSWDYSASDVISNDFSEELESVQINTRDSEWPPALLFCSFSLEMLSMTFFRPVGFLFLFYTMVIYKKGIIWALCKEQQLEVDKEKSTSKEMTSFQVFSRKW